MSLDLRGPLLCLRNLSVLTLPSLGIQIQAMPVRAAVIDICISPRLLFAERSPHRAYHDTN